MGPTGLFTHDFATMQEGFESHSPRSTPVVIRNDRKAFTYSPDIKKLVQSMMEETNDALL